MDTLGVHGLEFGVWGLGCLLGGFRVHWAVQSLLNGPNLHYHPKPLNPKPVVAELLKRTPQKHVTSEFSF